MGNPGFVCNFIYQNSTCDPKYDERNVFLQLKSRFKWKFDNAVQAPNASILC